MRMRSEGVKNAQVEQVRKGGLPPVSPAGGGKPPFLTCSKYGLFTCCGGDASGHRRNPDRDYGVSI